MKEKVTVCVITFNSVKYLSALLDSIRDSTFREFRLLFIDNGSTDGTMDYLEKDRSEKEVISLPENTGHSHAANLALKKCRTRYLILLDHDTIVDRDLFRGLYLEAGREQNTDFAVFAPKIIDRARDEVYYGGEFHYIGKTHTNRERPEGAEVGMIGSTAPLLDLSRIPPDLAFDDDFFIYWNDADFFYRLRAAGKKIKLVPEALVYHLGGTEDYSHRRGVKYSPIRAFYVMRNHRLFVIKNYSPASILIFLPCFLLYELFNLMFCIRKRVFIKGYLRSVAGTAGLFFSTMMKRSAFQKTRKIGEKDLVGWYRLDYNPGVVSTDLEDLLVRIFDRVLRTYYLLVKAIFWR
ncbi:MAG: glycosyltransferase [Candidatus Omnitrophica bacterium]|nr:glycosyltransferase [Candidatus Omnitrophota bacterium]